MFPLHLSFFIYFLFKHISSYKLLPSFLHFFFHCPWVFFTPVQAQLLFPPLLSAITVISFNFPSIKPPMSHRRGLPSLHPFPSPPSSSFFYTLCFIFIAERLHVFQILLFFSRSSFLSVLTLLLFLPPSLSFKHWQILQLFRYFFHALNPLPFIVSISHPSFSSFPPAPS